MKVLIGQKIGMTQLFNEEGNVVPVTLIEAGPCVVTQVKTKAHDDYNAIQLGWGHARRLAKPQAGHLKAAGADSRVMREVRVSDITPNEPEASQATEAETAETELELKVGAKLDAEVFEVGDLVQVTGVSKGKGFAGTIKRHNFHRGPKTHGSHNYRAPGSIGAGYPEHVFKGMRMAGRMGHDQVTVKDLPVVMVDASQNLIAVRGAVPGPKRGILLIRGKQS
jgi:large subunit ribosomal protein L3